MLDDAELRRFASEHVQRRTEVIQASGYGYLAQAWQRGETLYDAWYDNWRHQWPDPAGFKAAMNQLGQLFL